MKFFFFNVRAAAWYFFITSAFYDAEFLSAGFVCVCRFSNLFSLFLSFMCTPGWVCRSSTPDHQRRWLRWKVSLDHFFFNVILMVLIVRNVTVRSVRVNNERIPRPDQTLSVRCKGRERGCGSRQRKGCTLLPGSGLGSPPPTFPATLMLLFFSRDQPLMTKNPQGSAERRKGCIHLLQQGVFPCRVRYRNVCGAKKKWPP